MEQLAAGYSHTCARYSTGRVRCWGANEDGRRGDGKRQTRFKPRVLDEAGVLCWHEKSDDERRYDEPVQCGGDRIGLAEPTSVALGLSHGCAVLGSQDIRCWGSGRYGWLNTRAAADRRPKLLDARR